MAPLDAYLSGPRRQSLPVRFMFVADIFRPVSSALGSRLHTRLWNQEHVGRVRVFPNPADAGSCGPAPHVQIRVTAEDLHLHSWFKSRLRRVRR